MTDQEWKHAYIPPKLGKEWSLVMDALWIVAQVEFGKKAKNIDNQINIGHWWIYANFINNEYIMVEVKFKEEDRLSIRHSNRNLPSILMCVFEIVKSTNKVKKK